VHFSVAGVDSELIDRYGFLLAWLIGDLPTVRNQQPFFLFPFPAARASAFIQRAFIQRAFISCSSITDERTYARPIAPLALLPGVDACLYARLNRCTTFDTTRIPKVIAGAIRTRRYANRIRAMRSTTGEARSASRIPA